MIRDGHQWRPIIIVAVGFLHFVNSRNEKAQNSGQLELLWHEMIK
jgi:hypothetical protein